MSDEQLAEALRAIDAQYNLGSNFLLHLYVEDDWSFVVKAHALIEAAVSQLLTHEVGDKRLSGVFERLELSNPNTGRLAFAKALNLLTDGERRFVRGFSELRNQLVHNVHNVRFCFTDHLAALDTNQRKAFLEWISYHRRPSPDPAALRTEAEGAAKHTRWNATLFFVLTCLDKTNQAKHRQKEIARALDLLSALDEDEDDLDDS